MSVAFVAPRKPMSIGGGQVALWQALRRGSVPPDDDLHDGPLPNAIAGLSGWWDAGDISTAFSAGGTPVAGWNAPTESLSDKSGHGTALTPYSFGTAQGLPMMT